jgi:tripartite-type tricarboxylate transporter receptor subunit TctC
VEDPKSREAIAAQGVEPRASTPAEFRELFRAEYQRWGKVIREAHIKAD